MSETAERIVGDLSGSWEHQPDGKFGPADIVVHIVQANRFNLGWVSHQIGVEGSFLIPPPLQAVADEEDPAERHRILSTLNFEGARNTLQKFVTYDGLLAYWAKGLADSRRRFEQIPEHKYWEEVSHPLVTLCGPCIIVCHQLLISHTFYHLGQISQKLKDWSLTPPFPFGRFD